MLDAATAALATALCAAAVKLLDDFLDQDLDRAAGRPNLAAVFGNGSVVYAAVLLGLASGINAPLSLALFFASYAIGMVNELGRLLPSRLSGWQESLLALAAGAYIAGLTTALFALFFVLAIQLLDDCLDLTADRRAGQRNFAVRFGLAECLCLSLAAFLVAWRLDAVLFAPVLAGTALVYIGSTQLKEVKI